MLGKLCYCLWFFAVFTTTPGRTSWPEKAKSRVVGSKSWLQWTMPSFQAHLMLSISEFVAILFFLWLETA